MPNPNRNKKDRERRILFQIYDKDEIDEPIESERPDFHIRRKGTSSWFGVEVVENYSSESSARMEHIARYGHDLLDGKPHRHKEDKGVLIVDKIDILDKDDGLREKGVPAIIYKLPTMNESAKLVAEKIEEKSRDYQVAQEALTHVNLILVDRSHHFIDLSFNEFYLIYFKPQLLQQMCNTPFRQVYYLAKFNDVWKFCSLNMVLVVSELYMLNHWLKSTQRNMFQSVTHCGAYFASYLQSIVANKVFHLPHKNGHEVIYGDTGVLIREDMSVAIRKYVDYPLPSKAIEYDKSINYLFQTDMLESVNECRRLSVFQSDLLFPVNCPDILE